MAAHNLLKEVLDALNNNSLVGGIFCHLIKAFDCVNHGTLLSNMQFYGIEGIFYNLIKSYLNNRYQRVVRHKVLTNIIQTGNQFVMESLKVQF
jgi:hypothetical protein